MSLPGSDAAACVMCVLYDPVQADVDTGAEQEATEALHQSLSPAERSAIVESLPAEIKAASSKCMDALGGLDSEASSFCHYPCKGAHRWLVASSINPEEAISKPSP